MLLTMTRIQIIGLQQHQPQTLQLLHRLGVVQIIEWRNNNPQAPSLHRASLTTASIQRREKLSYLLTQTQSILSNLPAIEADQLPDYEAHSRQPAEWLIETVETDLAGIEPQVQLLTQKQRQLEERFSALPRYEATLKRLLPLTPALVDLETYAVSAIWLERRYREVLNAISQELETLTGGQCEIISAKVEDDLLAAILVYPKNQTETVSKFLGQENISQVRLPSEFSGQPLLQAHKNIQQEIQAIPRQLEDVQLELETLAHEWRPRLQTWQALLRDQLAEIDICAQLGQTDYTFVLEGWVPQKQIDDLKKALRQQVGEAVILIVDPPAETEETAPVAFDNPTLVKPFEPLVSLLALPKYGEFDPTPLMAVFMPIFFGLILGDVAYGLILLGLMLYLRHRFKARHIVRSLTEVLIAGSIWSIFFGFLFGEFLGTLGEDIGLHPLWFDRGHDVESLFLLTIGIGAGHIVLGLGLGVWQAAQQRNRHKLLEKVAMLTSLAALFLMVAVLTGFLPGSFFTPITALLVVGLAVLIYSMGKIGLFLGPLEFLETIGNILSYLRIAAIGLASVYLAQVANELAGLAGNLLVGVIIAVLFHALNIALGAFSPTIQSLRLHYVEFFGKFYEGGGQPFRPFKRSI